MVYVYKDLPPVAIAKYDEEHYETSGDLPFKAGFIDNQKVLDWYNSKYSGVNFNEETKTKLNRLIEEFFLKKNSS